MRTIFIAIIAGFLLAAVNVGFFSALPWPLPLVSLPLAVALLLVQDFRLPDAIALTVAAGITTDAMEPGGIGFATFALLGAVTVAAALFTRILTNKSFFAHILLHTIAFATFLFLTFLFAEALHAFPFLEAAAALTAQLVISFAAAAILRRGQRAMDAMFLFASRTS